MFKDYETKKFTDLVDPESYPVCNYAKFTGQSNADAYASLCDAFEKAVCDNAVNCDDDGWAFETDFANVLLVRNQDYLSRYERHMKFEMKPAYTAETKAGKTGEIALPESFDAVSLPAANLERLNGFIGTDGKVSTDGIVAALGASYAKAFEKDLFTAYRDSYNFDTDLRTENGEIIYVGIKPISPMFDGKSWLLNYVGYKKSMGVTYFSSAIEEFADMCGEEYLEDLASLARSEKWYFGNKREDPEILKNYITYTFYKLRQEDKIFKSADGRFAAFNTGLASFSYDDVYMCFRRADEAGGRFRYEGVCTAADSALGKQLVSVFRELPPRAEYITRKEDVLYDMSKQLFIDFEHILLDRIHRIPAKFLEMYLRTSPECKALLDKGEMSLGTEREDIYAELADRIWEDLYIYESLKTALRSVVDKTLRTLRWNYRMAIPSYFPKGDAMSLLLPMDFTGEGKPQAALVVRLTESGNYIGHTILSMDYAYLNARLISSQESSWLTA